MGATVCAAVAGDPELELVAGVDPGAVGQQVEGITIAGEPDALLESLAGNALRLGIKASVDGTAFPFALAPVGGRVAVEGAGDEARATFVFETTDVDRLNAVLLLTSFRREAISFPEDQLGRWAVAVRTLEVVRWARRALLARVVHGESWESSVRSALTS